MNAHQFTEPYRPREWEATYSLDQQVAEARRQMGERRWARLMEEWERGDEPA